jgi:hypothetical protein
MAEEGLVLQDEVRGVKTYRAVGNTAMRYRIGERTGQEESNELERMATHIPSSA